MLKKGKNAIKSLVLKFLSWLDDSPDQEENAILREGIAPDDTEKRTGLTLLGLGRVTEPEPSIRINRNNRELIGSGSGSNLKPAFGNKRLQRTDLPSPKTIAGRRISMENPSVFLNGLQTYANFSKLQYWHNATLLSKFNTDDFSKLPIDELAELITELSPEVSAALWYYLLCCNSGYEINVYKPKTKDVYPEAQDYVNQCCNTLGRYNGTLNTFFDKTFMCVFMRGSFLYELVLGRNRKDFVDVASPDTKTLKFKMINDEMRGQIWDFYQMQNGRDVSLNIPTIRYIPLHPLPGKIEGRAMISPSFFVTIFLMSVLRDLKRVVQQQGYMRLDLSVELAKLQEAMPDDAENDPEVYQQWCDSIIETIVNYYGELQPDDAFVHTDAVSVNAPVGTANMNSLSAMDALFQLLERMAVRSLKTIPSLLGINETASQGAENRRFEFYQKGNESVQRMVETGFSDMMELALQAKGLQADVELKFAQMRASEELRDLQIEFLKATIAGFYYDRGWFNQDEAAKMATKKDKSDQAEPRTQTTTGGNGVDKLQPDSSVNRFSEMASFLHKTGMFRAPNMQELQNALNIWKENAPDEAKELITALPFVSGNGNGNNN